MSKSCRRISIVRIWVLFSCPVVVDDMVEEVLYDERQTDEHAKEPLKENSAFSSVLSVLGRKVFIKTIDALNKRSCVLILVSGHHLQIHLLSTPRCIDCTSEEIKV